VKRIRSGRGLGDSLYLHCIVRHVVARGERLEVCTSYPGLFPFDVRFAPWSRQADITVHYVSGKNNPRTTQWQDCCTTARTPAAEYRGHWPARPSALVDDVLRQAAGRPLLLVNGGRWPMDRLDGFGRDLLPDPAVFNGAIARLREAFFVVFIGRGARLFPVACDLDLNDRTAPADVMDLATAADAGFAQCGFMIPLMEMFDRPLLVMFTGRGFASRQRWIAQMTPQKLLGKTTSRHVVDDWEAARRAATVNAFCASVAGGRVLPRQVGGDRR
jgi:hypothetical protein